MTTEAADTGLDPDALFVVACPLCRGQVAATGSLCGHDVCCPLCANLFHVPFPAAEPVVTEPSDEPEQDAGGWNEMASQFGGGPRNGEAGDEACARVSSAMAEPTIAAGPPAGADPATAPTPDAVEHPPAVASTPLRSPVAGPPAPEAHPAPESRSVPAVDSTLPPPADPAAVFAALGGPAVPPPVDAEIVVQPGPADPGPAPSAKELVFAEPVRTIRQGGRVIELRRLTPEERRTRRFRRNVMMIVVGVSILLVIVLLFGVPSGRR